MLALACCAVLSTTAAGEEPAQGSLPARLSIGAEEWRLPRGEKLGAAGLSYTVEVAPGWWIGPALYGAATGDRGGLFTWGVEAQRRWPWGARWQLAAGVYAGAGGGAAAPVGGGLMIRPHLDAIVTVSDWEFGASVSRVHFPDGRIGSTQLGLLVTVPDSFAFAPPGGARRADASVDRGRFHADRIGLTLGHYTHGSRRGHALDTAGIRLEQQLDGGWSGALEAAGAARGGGDGYAEMLIGVSKLWPMAAAPWALGGRVSAGMAGGGGVRTGGGLVWKLAAVAEWPLGRVGLSDSFDAPGTLSLEAGRIHALSGPWRSSFAQVALSVGLSPLRSGTSGSSHDIEWSLASQTYASAARKQGRARSLSTLGLRFTRLVDDTLYVTGQAHGAAVGGAGAFSAGLVGVGMSMPLAGLPRWRGGGEASLGVAGGGGVSNGGGAVVQPLGWVEHSPSTYQRWRFGAGYLQSMRGELSTPVIELSWGLAFGRP